MRLFQNSALYPSYLARLNQLAPETLGFEERRHIFLGDRFGALHFLKAVLEGNPDAFFTNGDDEAPSDRGFLQPRSRALPQHVRPQVAWMRQENAMLASGAVGTSGSFRLWPTHQ
jgi:hypothetical protein